MSNADIYKIEHNGYVIKVDPMEQKLTIEKGTIMCGSTLMYSSKINIGNMLNFNDGILKIYGKSFKIHDPITKKTVKKATSSPK